MTDSMPIFDAHSHAFPDHIAPGAMKVLTAEALWMPVHPCHDGTIAGLQSRMDAAGVRCAIMCSIATKPTQVPKITDWSASVASERVIPFASIHPDFGEPEKEIERMAGLGVRGLKFHPQYMKCPADDPRVLRILRAAAGAGIAATFHAGYDLAFPKDDLASPQRLRRIHEEIPQLRLLCCHLGGWNRWEEVLDVLAGLPVWFETSFTLGQCDPDLQQRIMERHSPEYLLWGTDSPWADPVEDLARFRALPLAEEVKRRALWENAWRYLGLPVPPA